MDQTSKPYDIKERVFVFACDVIKAYPRARLDSASHKVWAQLIVAATSSGAHLEEAAAGGSRAHFLSLNRGALREMRESCFWLRLMVATELQNFKKVMPLLAESREPVAILSTIVRPAYENGNQEKRK